MEHSTQEALQLAFESQRAAYAREPMPSLAVRKDRLKRLIEMTRKNEQALCEAIAQDFGHRAHQETMLAEVFTSITGAEHALKHLRSWMKTRRMPTALHFMPGSNALMPQPLGVVGIIAPWNYPYYLTTGPALAALAAGNRVMIKPSELTPATSALMARMVAEHFSPEEMTVLTGDADLARAFSALPFDHLFFTGSTAVGRHVAQAAAKNLTPVTLELGGKSPAIFDRSCKLELSASRLAYGKLLNAGQTCVAPDYVLAPRDMVRPLAEAVLRHWQRMVPTVHANPDYTSIATPRHRARLQQLLDDAKAHGAELLPSHPQELDPGAGRKLVPHVVLTPRADMQLMREEIFGPILPIVPYDSLEQAIAQVNAGDRPLALYFFGEDRRAREQVLNQTHAGGVTINDCIWHLGQESQPFGGVGASGMGAYHGEWGFDTFSKLKPVFVQSRFAGTRLFQPPYGSTFKTIFGLLRKIV